MTAWGTWAEVGTALGTLGLAGATFSSVRSSSRTARIAERALLASQRPVLAPSGPGRSRRSGAVRGRAGLRPPRRQTARRTSRAGSSTWPSRSATLGRESRCSRAYHLQAESADHVARDPKGVARHRRGDTPPGITSFAPQQRDLLISTGRVGFWQAALRDPGAPLFAATAEALDTAGRITVDILYGDHEGGQPTITRLVLLPDDASVWRCDATRYWNLQPATDELRDLGFA